MKIDKKDHFNDRNPVTSHAGVASVGVGGKQPVEHDCGADCANSDTNAEFNQTSQKGPGFRGIVGVAPGGK